MAQFYAVYLPASFALQFWMRWTFCRRLTLERRLLLSRSNADDDRVSARLRICAHRLVRGFPREAYAREGLKKRLSDFCQPGHVAGRLRGWNLLANLCPEHVFATDAMFHCNRPVRCPPSPKKGWAYFEDLSGVSCNGFILDSCKLNHDLNYDFALHPNLAC